MKTHVVWFCIVVAALVVGMRLGRQEVQIEQRPTLAETVRANDEHQRNPVETARATPPTPVKTDVLPAATPPSIVPRPVLPAAPAATPTRSPAEVRKLHDRYDPFLARWGLTPAQMDRFVELKLSIFDAQRDIQGAMEEKGAQGGTGGIEALRRELTKPMWDEIYQLLGPEGSKAYGDYEGMSAVRPLVTSLFQGGSVAVSDIEADQLARLVLKHNRPYRAKTTDLGTRTQIDWAAVARDAEPFLAPVQLQVLRAKAASEPMR
jgi:hypothetical protein